jgi:cephalosporin-C deacetylase
MPAPNDLWEFWDDTIAELAAIAPDEEITPAPEHSSETALVYHVAFTSWGGERVRGWYVTPPAPPGVRLAGLLWPPGYGGIPDVSLAIEWAAYGFAVLLLTPRGQGPDPYPAGSVGKLVSRIDDPSEYSYRGVYMDCLRGFDFLQSQVEVHPHKVAVVGGSQGGGLTLATAALAAGRVAVAAAHIPFLCHYEWVLNNAIEAGPFREIKEYQAENPDLGDMMGRTLSYFDPVNLAERIACPVLLTMGERDNVCPPPTIRAVYDRIGTTKSLLSEPEMAHEWLPDSREHMQHWLTHHLA